MVRRANKRGWYVLVSIAADDGAYCVDLFERPAVDFGFQQFRSDAEDNGEWTPIGGAVTDLGSATEAANAAAAQVHWLTTHSSARHAFEDWRSLTE